MRVALIWLLLIAVSMTNLAVAADAHFAKPATSSEQASAPGSDDPAAPVCQICLHGPALTLLPELPSVPARPDRPPSPAHATRSTYPATPPDRIDEPPRPTAR